MNTAAVPRGRREEPATRAVGTGARAGGERRRWLVLAALLTAVVLPFQGSRGLWEPDEGRYVDVAVEMIRLGDFLHPHLHHEVLHYTKPPLTYWAIAGGLATVGWDEWGARLPNAAAFVATGLLLAFLGRFLVPSAPFAPAVVYGTSLLPFVAANVVNTDSLLALWETAAMAAFVAAEGAADAGLRRRWLFAGWAAFGLAFLTKGPPGLLPLAALLAYRVMRSGRRGLAGLATAPGLAAFAGLGLVWFAFVIAESPGLAGYFLGYEVVARIASGVHDRNPQWYGAFGVYGPVFFAGTLPWTGLLARAARRALPRLGQPATWRRRAAGDPAGLLLGLWLLLPLAVFLIARSRMAFYLLPSFAPLALLAARALPPGRLTAAGGRLRLPGWLAVWAVGLVALKGVAGVVPHRKDSRAMARAVEALGMPHLKEVAFIDSTPAYGLSLYLGAEVEPLRLRHAGYGNTLAEELREPEHPRLFAAPLGLGPGLGEAVAAEGVRFREVGRHGNLGFYVSEPAPAGSDRPRPAVERPRAAARGPG